MNLDELRPSKKAYREIDARLPGRRAFQQTGTGCTIIVSKDGGAWHLSISHELRYPRWRDITRARYEMLPNDITMAMLLPPREEYVNLHPNCFHLWEIHPHAP